MFRSRIAQLVALAGILGTALASLSTSCLRPILGASAVCIRRRSQLWR